MAKYGVSIRKVSQEKHEIISAGLLEIENMSKKHIDKIHTLQAENNKEIVQLQGQFMETEELSVIEKQSNILRFRINEKKTYTLHKLCREGNMKSIKAYIDLLDDVVCLTERLTKRKGVFGYTPLHEAVAGGKYEVLRYLLDLTGSVANVNCQANSGFTPLHLAASSGHGKCVRELLAHGADISCVDEYGKTPKQTAELSSKSSIVKLLRSEGEP
ncbi:MAG: ankyrin repeat domain-containing protein [Proteobacteria bacterium]|nr:ankyrin repeat domain-containing protein [Pseudomonadota bacterium]